METPKNGNGWKSWMLGLTLSISFAAIGYGWAANYTRIDRIEEAQQLRGERLAKVEVELVMFKALLIRIEEKLDKLLDERRKDK